MEMYLEVEDQYFQFFRSNKNGKSLNVTDKRMTRFNISIRQACDMIIWALKI